MLLKVFILSVILVAFTILALGVKLLFNRKATFTKHACAMKEDDLNNEGVCAACDIKELANCTEDEK
jgi:hypothetical protein